MSKTIHIPKSEMFNEATQEFYTIPETELKLEHSLVSVQKWESKWKKPFLSREQKNIEEIKDYIKCMTLTQNVDPMVYENLTVDTINEILAYIEDPMTATTFSDDKTKKNNEILTSEIIYSWMIMLNIPSEYKKWHLNQLLTLCKVCQIKQNPNGKKMSRSEILSRNKALNEARKAKYKTRG